MNRPILPLALAAIALFSTAAQANTVAFDNFTAGGAETVNIAISKPNVSVNEYVYAGGFSVRLDNSSPFEAFCIDPYQNIWLGGVYDDYSVVKEATYSFANPKAAVDLGKLYSEKNKLNSTVAEAAFQIDVWEIAFETSGKYNLGTGSAQFTGGSADSSGALALATTWLNELATTPDVYQLGVLKSPGYQDQVYAVSTVPEPATCAMLVVGLLGIAGLRRTRRNAR